MIEALEEIRIERECGRLPLLFARYADNGDHASLAQLFTEDCEYSYRPHGDTVRGRDAIVRSWLDDDPDKSGTYDASYVPFAVEGDAAVAVGTSSYTEPETVYDNCYLLRFDAGGRC